MSLNRVCRSSGALVKILSYIIYVVKYYSSYFNLVLLLKMTAVSEIWVSWFSCCIPQPQKRHRHRIDRSMIGLPMNFQHTAHIGSRDVEMPNDQLTALQMQMKSKGGYENSYKEPEWCR